MPQTSSPKPKTFAWPMLLFVPISLSPSATTFKSELETLLLDATFLPDGGVLGFNLEHYYPVQNSSSSYVDLSHVGECLKGTDAGIIRFMSQLGV